MENHRQSNKTNTGHSRSTDKRPCSNQSGSDNLCDPSLSDQLNSHSTSAEHRPVDGGAVENPSRFDEGSPRGKGMVECTGQNMICDIFTAEVTDENNLTKFQRILSIVNWSRSRTQLQYECRS